MDTRVLVYDSQIGYFELLKQIITNGFTFHKYSVSDNTSDYGVLAFFLHDDLELLDFIKLYTKDKPVILGSAKICRNDDCENNISYLDISLTKEMITENIKMIFASLLK